MLRLVQTTEDAATSTWVPRVSYRKHILLYNFSEAMKLISHMHIVIFCFIFKNLVFTFTYASTWRFRSATQEQVLVSNFFFFSYMMAIGTDCNPNHTLLHVNQQPKAPVSESQITTDWLHTRTCKAWLINNETALMTPDLGHWSPK